MKVLLIYLRKTYADIENGSPLAEAKSYLISTLPYWVAGIATALAATAFSKLFLFTELQSQELYSELGSWMLVVVPLLFILSWIVIELFAPYANGSGIPQLMAAAHLSKTNDDHWFISKLLGLRIIVVKVTSAILAVLAGGAIGREGPTLQIAGSVFHITDRLFSRYTRLKSHHGMILAGGAAGLASAFNTPLGGIAYVVEELSKSHLSSFRTGILHSVIMAGLAAQIIMGPYLYLGFPKVPAFENTFFAQVILISITAGIVATIFSQILKLIVGCRIVLCTRLKRLIFAGLCGLSFAVFAIYISKNAVGSGKEILNSFLFADKRADFLEVFSRLFGSVITYAIGGAGGIFAPTLSLGGAAASYVSGFFTQDIGALSVLVGMTAALAALTHSPLTSFILILEMTDRHSAIFPLMIAAVFGHAVSKLISRKSFYETICEQILGKIEKGDEGLSENSGEIRTSS